MKELITICVGQAGMQLGTACWSAFSKEHNISPDGTQIITQENEIPNEQASVLFAELPNNTFTPRCIFADIDPDCVTQMRSRFPLMQKHEVITYKDTSGSCCMRGYGIARYKMLDSLENELQKVLENCDSPQGILILHSISGGTGSGLTTLILEQRASNKCQYINFTLFPSQNISNIIVEPYNSVLSIPSLIDISDMTVMFQNESIYNIFNNKLPSEVCNYSNVNDIIANFISSFTSPLRFQGTVNGTIPEIISNLVPKRPLNFVMPSFSPITPRHAQKSYSLSKLTEALFDSDSFLCQNNSKSGKIFASNLFFRGDIMLSDVKNSFSHLQRIAKLNNSKFDTYGLSFQGQGNFKTESTKDNDKEGGLICNSTNASEIFQTISKKFDKMFAVRSHTFPFICEGMEKGQFEESRESLFKICKEYDENNLSINDN